MFKVHKNRLTKAKKGGIMKARKQKENGREKPVYSYEEEIL